MNVLDLFSGIGGFSLGFEWASPIFKTVAFCEIDKYAQKVLKKHWPEVLIYDDIRKIGKKTFEEIGQVDIITAGFPCQDISQAGKQKGLKDEKGNYTRSGLFFEIIRLAELCRPGWIVLENVAALLSRPEWMGAVLGSLSEVGYDAEWEIIRASDMGAPHQRARVWIVAYPSSNRRAREGTQTETEKGLQARPEYSGQLASRFEGRSSDVAHAERVQLGQRRKSINVTGKSQEWGNNQRRKKANGAGEQWTTEPDVGRVAHGIPSRVDRLKCLGNAIVPQIAELIGRKIMEVENG